MRHLAKTNTNVEMLTPKNVIRKLILNYKEEDEYNEMTSSGAIA